MTGTCPHGWTYAHTCPTQPAPDLSDYERATVERIEAAPAAEESLRERVARAIADTLEHKDRAWYYESYADLYLRYADAAIAVMRGEL